jgi:hypothetical protein
MQFNSLKLSVAAAGFLLSAVSVQAATCVGSCGNSTIADGVVSLAPGGGGAYQWISTLDGTADGGVIADVGDQEGGSLGGVDGAITGSKYVTNTFTAMVGDILQFDFNFVTSDGGDYTDYAWAELQTGTGVHVAWLFTARTSPSGNTSPGTGLGITNSATLNPASTAIQAGTNWSVLGISSGTCFDGNANGLKDDGCGNTGWINSSYAVANAGTYQLVLGVQNWNDGDFDSGLAFAGAKIGGISIEPGDDNGTDGNVPLPAAAVLLVTGLAGLGGVSRLRKSK